MTYWRNRLFIHVMTYLLPLSIIPIMIGVTMCLVSGLYFLALAEIITFLFLVIISFSRADISTRKAWLIITVHLIASLLIYYLGSLGPGMLYLLAATLFTVLIFPPEHGWWSTVSIAAICMVIALGFYFRLVPAYLSKQYSLAAWLTVSCNVVVLSCIIVLLLLKLFQKVENASTRYRSVAKATSDTIYEWNLTNGKIEFSAGVQKMFGYSLEEIASGHDWWIGNIHPEDRDKVVNEFNRILEDTARTNLQIEHRILCSDGTYKHVYNRVLVVRDNEGKPLQLIGAVQDRTELRRHITAIERHNKLLQEISWIQSHKVRSPLATILGLLPLLDTTDISNTQNVEVLEGIEQSCLKLDAVIREITDLCFVTVNEGE